MEETQMKKILSVFMAVTMLLGVFTGCSSSKNGSETTETSGSPVTEGEAPEASYTEGWLSTGYEKVRSDHKTNGEGEFVLYMAKNEKESCTYSIRSEKRLLNLNLECVERADGSPDFELLKEFTVTVAGKDYPDPLVALNKNFSVSANSTQSILVRFNTTSDTVAGAYDYTFALKNKNGQVINTFKVTVNVWDIEYPEVLTSYAFMDIDCSDLALLHKVEQGTEEFEELYLNYYELLLDYGTSAYELPYDILDPRADAYMSDPRVKAFLVADAAAMSEITDEKLAAIYAKLKTNPEWLAKAVIYPFDEPTTDEHMQTIVERCERLDRICPEISRVVPFYKNPDYSADEDLVEMLSRYTDVYCPKSYCFRDGNIYTAAQKEKYGSFYDRMQAFESEGYRVWWYVCWEPGYPYCNMYVNEYGINHRVLFWQQSLYGVSAFLFWEANHWGQIKKGDPWIDMATVPSLSPDVYGDGCVVYNGSKIGLNTGVPSLRLDIIRDGLEDYELLEMARRVLGDEYVTKKIKVVSLDLVNHTGSAVTFEKVRTEIGNDLAAALKENK